MPAGLEDLHESSDSARFNTYSVNYLKGRRKIAIIRLMSLDEEGAFSTTFNAVDKFND